MLISYIENHLFGSVVIISSIFLALIFEKIILRRLIVMAYRTDWEGDDIIFNALKNYSKYLIMASGFLFCVDNLDIEASVINLVKNTLMIVLVLCITVILSRIAVGFVKQLPGKSEGSFPGSSIFVNITRISIFILGLLFIFQQMGISITPIITALGVGGLAVALALQDTLANLFAGLNVIAGRRIHQGDFISIDGTLEGYVQDITWRNTIIRELPNNDIIVPNTKLASAIVKNYSSPQTELVFTVTIGIEYGSDLEKIEAVAIDEANQLIKSHASAVNNFEPFLRFKEFADFSIDADVFLKAKSFTDRLSLRHQFIKNLYLRFKQENISIPFPTRTLHIKHEHE